MERNDKNAKKRLKDDDIIKILKEYFPNDSERKIECKLRCFKHLRNFHMEGHVISQTYGLKTYINCSNEVANIFFSPDAIGKGTYYTDVGR